MICVAVGCCHWGNAFLQVRKAANPPTHLLRLGLGWQQRIQRIERGLELHVM
jgi:hypothetical protein